MKSVLSLFIILFLLTSSIPFGFAETPLIDPISEQSEIVSSTPKESRNISISLQESVGIASNVPQKKSTTTNPSIISQSEYLGKVVYLSEDFKITSSILEQTIVHNMFIVQPQTILDRVSQIEKVKDRKKNSKIDLFYLDNQNQQQSSENLISIESNILQTTFFIDPFNLLSNSINQQNFENILEFTNLFEDKLFVSLLNSVSNFNSSFILDNSFIVVIFAPPAMFSFSGLTVHTRIWLFTAIACEKLFRPRYVVKRSETQ